MIARRRFYGRCARLLTVLAWGLVLAAGMALAERLSRGRCTGLRQRLTCHFMRRLSAALPFQLEVTGELPQQPMLWVANHVSWADIPLLGQLLPLSFLSKAEVRQWPLAGWLAQQAGTLFIRRGAGEGPQLNHQLAAHLRGGFALLLFPEGTSSDGTGVRPMHGRLLGSANLAGVAIQPVAIRYQRDGQRDCLAPFVGDDSLPQHLLRLLRSEVAQVQIQLLPPIASQGQERSAMARQAQGAIQQALFGDSATTRAA